MYRTIRIPLILTMKHLIWIIYDGIAHSVFAGQVIVPAVQFCEKNPDTHITVITFEKHKPSQALIDKYSSMHPHLNIKVMRKLPFLGMLSLLPALYQLKKFLSFDTIASQSLRMTGESDQYELKARGPLAGWLALHATDEAHCNKITVQARGLLTEEYWYRHGKKKNLLKRIFHIWRHRELEAIEREVYSDSADHPECSTQLSVSKEAVTTAMKDYLIKTFNADAQSIYIAQDDIPPVFEAAQVTRWKRSIRIDLNIAETAHVYCFIGSVKSWQKPDMVIEYFIKQLKINQDAILLLLTQDIDPFTQKLIDYNVSLSNARILSVPHEDIYRYLSAANTGLIFRDQHTLSLVARPVKAMEYQSVGLEIVHNGTVDWLNHHASQAEDVSQVDQS